MEFDQAILGRVNESLFLARQRAADHGGIGRHLDEIEALQEALEDRQLGAKHGSPPPGARGTAVPSGRAGVNE